MKTILTTIITLASFTVSAQQVVNDATAPLHLMKPAYTYPYGVPDKKEVKASIDRIFDYLDRTTFAELDVSGKQLRRGDFRLTSYEWGGQANSPATHATHATPSIA